MRGLLYKDFITTCRIKRINLLWILAMATFLFVTLRIVFPGTADNQFNMVNSIADIIFVMILAIFIIACMSFINSFTTKIIENDEKNKIMAYMKVMPFSNDTYIASNYIYLGLVCLASCTLEYIWAKICTAYCLKGMMLELSKTLDSFIIVFACFSIFIAAIELPMFLLWGKEKAMLIKVAILMFIAFVLTGFVLFGDLDRIGDGLDLMNILNWVSTHKEMIKLLKMAAFIVTLVLYYFSYKVTCKLYAIKDQKKGMSH